MLERILVNSLSRNKLSILIYHRVLAEGETGFGDPTESEFVAQMRTLSEHFNVMVLSEAVDRLKQGTLPPRAAVVTFDDGYRDNCTRAMPIMRRFGLAGTFFIATDFLDGGVMWNDKVTYSILNSPHSSIDLSHIGMEQSKLQNTTGERLQLVKSVLGRVKHLPDTSRQAAVEAVVSAAGGQFPCDLMMSSDELRKMHSCGMEIGAHTLEHPILSRIDDAEAVRQITQSKAILEERLQAQVSSFAYPNGKPDQDYLHKHRLMVEKAGFHCAVSTAWGVSSVGADLFQLPRFTPWDKTPGRFRLRLYRNLFRRDYAKTS